jgi:hypothetical protein
MAILLLEFRRVPEAISDLLGGAFIAPGMPD